MIKTICVISGNTLRIRLAASSAITRLFIDWRMMKFPHPKVIAIAALTGAMFCTAPYQALAQTDQVSRLCGETRYETAYESSKKLSSTSNTIILASGENFPDALAASALAGVNNAPILLTAKSSLSMTSSDGLKGAKPQRPISLVAKPPYPQTSNRHYEPRVLKRRGLRERCGKIPPLGLQNK